MNRVPTLARDTATQESASREDNKLRPEDRAAHDWYRPETIRWWVRHNGCAAEPQAGETLPGGGGSSGVSHTAQRLVYGPCREGSQVVLLRLTGAGHGWPGGESLLPERLMGPATSVIDASEELWKFLRRFSRPDAPPLP